ncbi:MAG: carbohydrate-binding family 6 protein, partial [Planctomycetota bacterium]
MVIKMKSVLFVLVACTATAPAAPVGLFYDKAVPQAGFAARDIAAALRDRDHSINLKDLGQLRSTDGIQILLTDLANKPIVNMLEKSTGAKLGTLHAEGFSIRVTKEEGNTTYWIIGADPAGAMYGGLELAEVVRVAGLAAVEDVDQNPYMAMRGTKFNIPLDVRTPSYTDVCDAAQKNIGEMWSFDFWKAYIDTLARYRFNFVSCWNLHPFPSLVRVPDYPEVALADVQRSTVQWKEHYDLEGTGFDAPEIINNVEILKKMTIDDKIAFWRRVMAYGKSRNVDFYFITWNIFINGTQGKYGITYEASNPITRDYFRKSVKQMFITYPDLKGIGLTTGENMYGVSFRDKEDWAYDTYAQGVLDAANEQPGRKITFIHRQHMAGALDIAEKFKPIIEHPDIEFIFSFKYAKAHVYSSTTQPYHPGFVRDIQGKGNLRTIWTLRNDDIYYFRWGAPDFVREFIQNIPYDVSRGYYYGSDQYIWGREFLAREPESPRQIEISKHWYQWMMWGRLGYDPTVSNERFTQILKAKYAGVDHAKLFAAWQAASMIYPKTTGFHWGALDFQWYIESSQSRKGPAETASGFHDVNRFITLGPHKGTDNLSIPDYVKQTLSNQTIRGTTPVQVALDICAHSDKALALLADLDHRGNKELRLTLDDIRTIAWLGKYYAHKIQAATELAFFRETLKPEHRDAAIEGLRQSAFYWRSYASLALSNHKNPLWTNRVGHVDWRETYDYVLHDIRSIGGTIDITSMPPSNGGTILEAEDAQYETFEASGRIKGYTGTGYVTMDRNKGP